MSWKLLLVLQEEHCQLPKKSTKSALGVVKSVPGSFDLAISKTELLAVEEVLAYSLIGTKSSEHLEVSIVVGGLFVDFKIDGRKIPCSNETKKRMRLISKRKKEKTNILLMS